LLCEEWRIEFDRASDCNSEPVSECEFVSAIRPSENSPVSFNFRPERIALTHTRYTRDPREGFIIFARESGTKNPEFEIRAELRTYNSEL